MSAAIENGQLKLSKWLEILFIFKGVGDASFHYELFPLRFLEELFNANLRIFNLLRDSENKCRFLFFFNAISVAKVFFIYLYLLCNVNFFFVFRYVTTK